MNGVDPLSIVAIAAAVVAILISRGMALNARDQARAAERIARDALERARRASERLEDVHTLLKTRDDREHRATRVSAAVDRLCREARQIWDLRRLERAPDGVADRQLWQRDNLTKAVSIPLHDEVDRDAVPHMAGKSKAIDHVNIVGNRIDVYFKVDASMLPG